MPWVSPFLFGRKACQPGYSTWTQTNINIYICVYKAYYIHCTLCIYIYIYICTHIHLPNLDFFPMLAQGDHLTAASGQRALRSALGSHGGHAGRVRAPSDAVTSLRRPVAWGGGSPGRKTISNLQLHFCFVLSTLQRRHKNAKHYKLAGRCIFLKGNNNIRKGCLRGRPWEGER